jgi:LPPG:FO 2-phospho-L-lactate transferase
MSDSPVRTRVKSGGGWHAFQEFMIRVKGPVEDMELQGIEEAAPTPEVVSALAGARLVIIGPSNPVISIGPILAVLGALPRPVVAVSPLVGGAVLKGPTDDFMRWRGHEAGIEGVASEYSRLADVLVADEPASGMPTHVCDVEMSDAAGRRRLAREVLAVLAGHD